MRISILRKKEPIVSTELDAVESFIKSGIKWMALGNYLVQNNI